MDQLNKELKVTREVKHAATNAIEDYITFKNFGSSTAGGYDEQPAEWVESITATTHAASRVEKLIEEEMRKEQEERAKKNKKGKGGR